MALDIYTVSPERTTTETNGSVTIHRLKPRMPLNYYPGLYFDLVPLDDTVLHLVRDRPPDVIHVATPGHIGITGLYLSMKLPRPVIGSYHTELPQYVSQRLTAYLGDSFEDDEEARTYVSEVSQALTWDYLACFYNHCLKVLVPSRFTSQQVAQRLRPPLELMPRGVDTKTFQPGHRTRPGGPPRVLYVGRLAVEKNLGWLVRFGQRHPEVDLQLVGDGPERDALRAALPHATFPGFLRDEALATAYADADVFAFPSLTETFGNVVLEAQASGLPAIVGDQGGPQEIIEPGRTGLVAATAEQFESHLMALLNDTDRRRTFGAAARARAAQRSWDEVFARLYQQYHSVAYSRRRTVWVRFLKLLKDSESPMIVGLVSFWKQFGRRRARLAARAHPLLTDTLVRPGQAAQSERAR